MNHTADRVSILLGDSNSQRNVPKALLSENSSVLLRMLGQLPQRGFEDPKLRLEGVKDYIFDMILQWLVTRNVSPAPLYSTVAEDAITTYLEFTLAIERLDIHGSSLLIEERLKKLLCESRPAMKSKHITQAFELPNDHIIRKLLVKALVRPYIQSKPAGSGAFKPLGAHNSENSDDSESSDAMDTEDVTQREIAFGPKFPFKREVQSIEGLEAELNSMVVATYSKMERMKMGRSRIMRCYLVDPLTEKHFEMP